MIKISLVFHYLTLDHSQYIYVPIEKTRKALTNKKDKFHYFINEKFEFISSIFAYCTKDLK